MLILLTVKRTNTVVIILKPAYRLKYVKLLVKYQYS